MALKTTSGVARQSNRDYHPVDAMQELASFMEYLTVDPELLIRLIGARAMPDTSRRHRVFDGPKYRQRCQCDSASANSQMSRDLLSQAAASIA